jgi:hypothetical protein
MGVPVLVIAHEPDSGSAAFYLDGKYVESFAWGHGYDEPTVDEALLQVFGRLGVEVDFRYEQRWMASLKTGGYFEPAEYEGYWPKNLEDTKPIDWEFSSPDDLVLPVDSAEELIF